MATDPDPDRHADADPAAAAARAELHAEVQRRIDALPPELRTPLLLRCQDGLTLAAVGTALRLPTSTVHDRVEAALHRLRVALGARGAALAGRGLPELMAELPFPSAPPGLEARLLALRDTALPVVAGVTRRLVLAAAALTATGLLVAAPHWVARPASDPALLASGAPVAAAAAAARPPQDPPPQPLERLPGGTPAVSSPAMSLPMPPSAAKPATSHRLVGSVHDAEAFPVDGATVQVVAGGGLKAFALGPAVRTDARGHFVVDVPPQALGTDRVRLQVHEHGRLLLQTGDVTLPRAASAPPLELVLPAAVGAATSRYACTVAVADAAGTPLVGVPVSLLPPTEPLPIPGEVAAEATGVTGPDGRVVLPGRGLGPKWLFVDGQPLGCADHFERLVVARAGDGDTRVSLGRGGELQVQVDGVDGGAPDWRQVHLRCDRTGRLLERSEGAAGSVRFTGLGAGTYTVTAHGGWQWSSAQRRGVRAGDAPVRFQLKRRTETRDVGDHMAELHGELVDAVSGTVVPYPTFAVDIHRIVAAGSSLPSDGIEPSVPAQQMEVEPGPWSTFAEVGLTAGRYAIVARVPGYAVATQVVELGDDELRAGIRVLLQRPAVVRGKLVDAAGQPVSGHAFLVGVGPLADQHLAAWEPWRRSEHPAGAREPSFTPHQARVAADGSFVLDDVPPGVELRLVLRHDAHGQVVLPLGVLRAGETIANLQARLPGR